MTCNSPFRLDFPTEQSLMFTQIGPESSISFYASGLTFNFFPPKRRKKAKCINSEQLFPGKDSTPLHIAAPWHRDSSPNLSLSSSWFDCCGCPQGSTELTLWCKRGRVIKICHVLQAVPVPPTPSSLPWPPTQSQDQKENYLADSRLEHCVKAPLRGIAVPGHPLLPNFFIEAINSIGERQQMTEPKGGDAVWE